MCKKKRKKPQKPLDSGCCVCLLSSNKTEELLRMPQADKLSNAEKLRGCRKTSSYLGWTTIMP